MSDIKAIQVKNHSKPIGTPPRRPDRKPYRGVSYELKSDSWTAEVYFKRKSIHLGQFESADSAYIAVCRFRRRWLPFTFQPGEVAWSKLPCSPRLVELIELLGQVHGLDKMHKNNPSRGITWDEARQEYRARPMWDGKRHSLGRFETQKEAMAAVREFKAERRAEECQ